MTNFLHIENNVVNNFIVSKTKHLDIPNQVLFFAVILFSAYIFNFIYLILFKFMQIGSNKGNSRATLKQLYVLSIGLFYIIGVLNSLTGFYLMFGVSLAVYLVSKYNYTNKNKSKNLPWYVLIALISFVLFCHINTDFIENGQIVTGALMVLVIKLHEFSWNCQDYANMDSDLLSNFQKDRVVAEFPGLLEFYSYVFYYGTLLTGPAFEYTIFIKWIKSDNYNHPIKNPALWKLGKGIMALIVFLKVTDVFPVEALLAKNDFSMTKKFFYMYIVGTLFRFKYYGAWSIAESLCNMIQLGYDANDNSYNLIKNVNIRGFEFAQNTKGALDNWNQSTNLWLKNYIYIRFAQVNKNATLASLITFFVSASWHGVYSGYYLTFITGSFYQTAGKTIRRFIRPHVLAVNSPALKKTYDFMTIIVTQTAFGYLAMPFIVLNIKDSMTIWKSVYFIPHILILILQLSKPFLKKHAVKPTPTVAAVIKDDDLKNILKDKFAYENKQKKD